MILDNQFLTGNYGPVYDEHTITDLQVTGTIPDYLDGRYLRNGPNPVSEVDPEAYNWFTGDAMVHGVRLRDGRAEWYRNRFVRTRAVSRALGEAAKPYGTSAGLELVGPNTNLIGHAGRTYALVEGGAANYELTSELETIGSCDFDGTLSGGYTAHPKRDPETGELHAVSYSFARGNRVQYSVIDAQGHARRTVDVEVKGSPMMHDFSLTEKHAIFYDLPVTFDPVQAVATTRVPSLLRLPARLVLAAAVGRVRIPDPITAATNRPLTGGPLPYRWNKRYPARIGVMPREGSNKDVRWFEIEPCYVFHPMNAYDAADGSIVLDVVRHDKVFDRDLNGPTEGHPTLDRWTVDLQAGKVRAERIDDRAQEFPRVDERLVTKRHRYGYAPAISIEAGAINDTLLKHDFVARGVAARTFGSGKEVSEFVFHPSAPDAGEDEGALLGFVYDLAEDRSDLVVLDAGTLDTMAEIHLPSRVPNGFHGNWVPTAGVAP